MATKTYTKFVLTGGGVGSLDAIDGDDLANGYRAIVITEANSFHYYLDATSGASENSPNVIVPDNNAGTKRWLLKDAVHVGSFFADYTATDQGDPLEVGSIAYYVALIGSDQGTIILRHDSGGATTGYNVGTDLTIPGNIESEIENGAILDIASGKTVTFNGPFNAGIYQVFSGAGLVAFSATSIGTIYPEWWGAVGDGATLDSDAFQEAIDIMGTRGGGIVLLTKSNYKISELVMDESNVVLQGDGKGYSYGSGELASPTVRLTCTTGIWAIRLSESTALKNLQIVSNGALGGTPNPVITPGVEYGVLIEGGFTMMDEVTVSKFQYGVVIASLGNSNIFDRCGFTYNTKVGFAVTYGSAATYATYHPNLTPPASMNKTTVYSLTKCNIRLNGWGFILRDGLGSFENLVTESNYFGGLYAYRGSLDPASSGVWYKCYFENNWSGFDKTAAYTITQNNLLQETAGVWISWTIDPVDNKLNDAGYTLNFNSNAGGSTGGTTHKFDDMTLQTTSDQKAIYLKSSFNCQFLGGGVTGNATNDEQFRIGSANITKFDNFWLKGTPSALVDDLGNRGVVTAIERSTSAGINMLHGRWKYSFDTQVIGAVDSSGDVETDLITTTILGDTIRTRGMRIVGAGEIINTSGTKIIKFYFGSEVIEFHPAHTGAYPWRFEADIPAPGVAAQYISWTAYIDNGFATVVQHGTVLATEDLTNDITIKFTGECSISSDKVRQNIFSLKGN